MDFINPYWTMAAAVALYLNTLNLLERIHRGERTNVNAVVGSFLTAYVVLSLIALCGR